MFARARTVWHQGTYATKHTYESDGGTYTTRDQFAGAVIIAGYEIAPYDRGTHRMYVRPRSRRRRHDALHVGRLWQGWWTPEQRAEFAALVAAAKAVRP